MTRPAPCAKSRHHATDKQQSVHTSALPAGIHNLHTWLTRCPHRHPAPQVASARFRARPLTNKHPRRRFTTHHQLAVHHGDAAGHGPGGLAVAGDGDGKRRGVRKVQGAQVQRGLACARPPTRTHTPHTHSHVRTRHGVRSCPCVHHASSTHGTQQVPACAAAGASVLQRKRAGPRGAVLCGAKRRRRGGGGGLRLHARRGAAWGSSSRPRASHRGGHRRCPCRSP
jgi:hypothetical protein